MLAASASTRHGHHGSSAVPLALAYVALVVYASLYPFEGWRWPVTPTVPPGIRAPWLGLPWFPLSNQFDVVSNLIGYLPLGALVYIALVRSGRRSWVAFLLAAAGPTLLSFALEHAQSLLPQRVPSVLDWLRNAAGAVLGAVLAAGVQVLGFIDRWQAARERWFHPRSAGGLALLLVWPLGLLFPPPVPFGMGPAWDRVLLLVDGAVVDVPWAQPLHDWIIQRPPSLEPMDPASEWLAVTFGLLAPVLLACVVTRPGWRRPLLALGAAVLGLAATTLSTTLNVGPAHALAWITPGVWPAVATALSVSLLMSVVGPRVCAAVALAVLFALVSLVAQAPADPYFVQSLLAWEQGRFIRFHGLAQWVGWLWPFATMGWLLARIAAREPG